MKLGDFVLSMSRLGWERRSSSKQERQRYAEENGLPNGNGRHFRIPKVWIISVLAGTIGFGAREVYQEIRAWRNLVDEHIRLEAQANGDRMMRLGVLEQANRDGREAMEKLAGELAAWRGDQLRFYSFFYERLGEADRARATMQELKTIEKDFRRSKKGASKPSPSPSPPSGGGR